MSIYAALKFPVPSMAYCAIHQVKKGVATDEYRRTMADFHALLMKETASIDSLWKAYVSEAKERAVQVVRGMLSPFLSTPLKSDDEEIRKIIREGITEFSKQVSPDLPYGMRSTSEGQIVVEPEATGITKKLLDSGKVYLRDLGFQMAKNGPAIFESVFLVDGGINFDIIEHIVRDRIGIYTPVHGKHILEFDAYAYAAYNRILHSGGQDDSGVEAAFFFSKGSTRYEPFRNGLSLLLGEIGAVSSVSAVSVWQRKLGLGAGREFVLRASASGMKTVHDIVGIIREHREREFARDAILGGALLVKERVR